MFKTWSNLGDSSFKVEKISGSIPNLSAVRLTTTYETKCVNQTTQSVSDTECGSLLKKPFKVYAEKKNLGDIVSTEELQSRLSKRNEEIARLRNEHNDEVKTVKRIRYKRWRRNSVIKQKQWKEIKFQILLKVMLSQNTTGLDTEALADLITTPATDANNSLRSSMSTFTPDDNEMSNDDIDEEFENLEEHNFFLKMKRYRCVCVFLKMLIVTKDNLNLFIKD
ncbi:hypothetical protein MtrunA17_Chr2g0305341 [Medicago truncatula]|uniref:Uncharacterized protein n=1 Tax=Medicago truncatula TaxID=3880 RepID=A0A396JFY7_MEDTR|nr:hypothetical protein MtrunA17_Chr2g0305341 [Medicago truncatula]